LSLGHAIAIGPQNRGIALSPPRCVEALQCY
jgi:hypothetical protein